LVLFPLAIALRAADVRPTAHLPLETPGFDNIVERLISVFDRADILALGESHQRRFDSNLRIRLVRHPDFARRETDPRR